MIRDWLLAYEMTPFVAAFTVSGIAVYLFWFVTKGRDEETVESVSLVADSTVSAKTLPLSPSENRESQKAVVVTFQRRKSS